MNMCVKIGQILFKKEPGQNVRVGAYSLVRTGHILFQKGPRQDIFQIKGRNS